MDYIEKYRTWLAQAEGDVLEELKAMNEAEE